LGCSPARSLFQAGLVLTRAARAARSTHGERQQVLQALLARGAAQLGRGVHSRAELNQLLARTPAELALFQRACPYPIKPCLLVLSFLVGACA